MKSEKLRLILLFIGGALIIITGLFFNICADIFLRAVALYLIIPLILALGSGILFLFSEADKEKKKRIILFKAFSIILTIGLIIFIFVFKNSEFYQSCFNKGNELETWCKIIYIVSLVLSFTSLIIQFLQLTLEGIFGEKD